MKIKNKMMLGFSLLITSIFTAVMIILSLFVKNNIEQNLDFQLKATTNSVKTQVSSFIDGSVKSYLMGIAEQNRIYLMSNSQNDETVKDVMHIFNQQKIGKTGYTYVLNTEGIIVSHPDSTKIGVESTFASSLKQMDNFTDEYITYEYKGRLKVLYRTYYQPLNFFISVTAYEDELLDLVDMDSLSEQILSIKIGENGYPYLFTTDLTVIAHPSMPYGSDISIIKDAEGEYLFRNMVRDGEGTVFYGWNEPDGSVKDKFSSFITMEDRQWVIATSGYKADYYSLLYTLNTVLVLLSIISIGIILVFVFIVSSVLVRSIVSTTTLLEDISRGEGDLTRKLTISSNDETGKMAEYFNTFTDKLASLINNVKNSSLVSVQIKENLSANFEETVSSLSQIDSNLQNVNIQMIQMDGKVSDSSSAVNQIISGIGSLDSQIHEQAGAVEESTASVTQMVSSLKSVSQIVARKREAANILVETSKVGGEQINLTNKTFEEGISAKISQISEMTTIIKSIASQTNLLSMNAAIEAAHAGESGKGFAVVADEIRKLAENSSENSKKISEVIKSIVQHIEITGGHVKNTAEAFVSIEKEVRDLDLALVEILNASEELSTGGEEILTAMTILADISANVTEKSSEIKDNSHIVTNSITEVSHISGDVTNAVSEVAAGTAEITNTMNISQNLLVDLGESTSKVNREVKKFKTE